MALLGLLGNNTKVGFSASSPVSYTKIGQLMNIDKFPELVANIVDTTIMGTSNQMTGMTGMIPIPSFEFTLLADLDQVTSAAHESIRQYSAGAGGVNSGTVIWFRIEVPTNTAKTTYRAFEFQGIVNGWNLNTPIADKQTLKITVVLASSVSVYNSGASILG